MVGLALIRSALIFSFIVLVATFQTNAQSTRTMDAAARRIDDFRKQSEKVDRDQMNKEMNGRKISPEELKRSALIKEQLKEDLEALQSEYNNLVTKIKSREQFSAVATTEVGDRVHSRSTRLLKNLNLPKPPENEMAGQKIAGGNSDVSMKTLCLKIFAIVAHPIFEAPSTIDIKTSAEVRTLLEEVIQISEALKQTK